MDAGERLPTVTASRGAWLARGRRVLAWVLAPLLLGVVLRDVDLARLSHSLENAPAAPLLLGLSLVGAKVLLGAWRWHALCRRVGVGADGFAVNLGRYLASLAMGALGPGTLGADVYRVAVATRRTADARAGFWVIVAEKLAAILSCVALVVGLAPWYGGGLVRTALDGAVPFLPFLLGAAVLMLLLGLILRRHRGAESTPTGDSRRALLVFTDVSAWLPALGLSLMIQVVGAVQGHLFLSALGHPLHFAVHLFVVPLTVLVLSLPITVAGIGVREGLFVMLYGAFGVPAEVALLAGFLFFISQTVGQAAGALAFLRVGRSPAPATRAG